MTIRIMCSSVYSIFHFSTLTKQILALIFLSFFGTLSAQVSIGFQGGEAGDPWGFTSTGASALSISEATQSPNKVTGTTSLVVGGNTAGGNCFATGSGNGPNTARTFTFDQLDITSSNASTRTLTFNWGNRFPSCSGTGWDSGENLTFRAYHDGVAQATITLATGNNNAQFSILTNSYTWSVPPCVNQFYFVVSVTTNRADELLFLDNVKITAPQLNGSLVTSPISGNTSVCVGATENYSVTPEAGISYTWSGLPTGASFTTTNGTTASSTIGVNWGTTPSGTYTLTVTPTNACGVIGIPQTISVTILPAPTPVTISGPSSMCPGDIVTLTSSYPTGNTWSPSGLTASGISLTTPGTYTVSAMTSCGIVTASHTVTLDPVPTIQSVTNTPISCFGASDGSLTITSSDSNLEYSLDGITWQTGNIFSNLSAGTYTPRVRFIGGCSTTLSPVQLIEPAVVTANASSTGSYCAGSTVFLHGTTTSGGTPTFSWTGPNGFVSTLQDPTDIRQAGTYTYQLVVSINGCQSAPVTTTVTVNPIPVATASNTGPYCTGDVINLTGSTTSTGAVTYSWTGPNGYISSVQNPSDATLAGTYQLVINETGCQSIPVNTTVIIHSIPVAQASYVAPFCNGTSLQLNGSTTSTGTVTYSWSGPNSYASTLQNPSDASIAGTYTLIVTESGCSSIPATVNVISQIPAASASNTGPYCEGSTVFLHGTTASIGTPTFSWTGPNGFVSTLQDPTDLPQAGTHTYQLVVSINGCQSTPVTTTVTVNPIPVATASNTGPYCTGDIINLTGSTTLTGTVTYSWTGSNGYTSSVQNPSDATLAGTYQLVISANGCQSNQVSTTVIIHSIPVAQASYVAPFCNGTSLQLNGSTTSTGTVTYSWSGPNSYASTLQNPSDASIAGTYTLIVTEAGCASIPATVNVISQIPVASASNTGPYCAGSTVFLHGTTTSIGTPMYNWTGPNGFVSTLQDPTDLPQAGTYTYQLVVSINGCQSVPATTAVTVNPIPVATASNTGSYCTGDAIQLTGSTTLTGTVTYSWTGPNGYTSSVQNPSNATSAGSYQLVISANGCQSNPVSTAVVIHSIPVAQASYVAPFCPGMPLQLNGTTTSTGTPSYLWTGPNSYTSTVQNPSDATAAGTYTLIVTEAGCSSVLSSVLVISQIPSIVVSNTGPYCEGLPVQLNGSTTSTGTVTYSWVGPNGYISQIQNPSDATLAGTYTLTINENGCTNVASTDVTIHSNPLVGFSSTAPCMNDSVVFLSSSSVPSPEIIANWHWDFNDGFTSSEQNPRHLFGSMGVHPVTLKVITASNCSTSITKDIEVKPAIEANFYFSPTTASVIDPTVHFVNSSSNATTYLWNFGYENNLSTETSPDFTYPAQPSSYAVKLVVSNEEGCMDSITKIISIKDELIHYVPNAFTPDGDEFNQTFQPVFSSGFDPQNFTFLIYNRWGETVFESHDSTIGWDGTYQGEMVPEGTYVWNITVKQLHSDAFETYSGHVSLVR